MPTTSRNLVRRLRLACLCRMQESDSRNASPTVDRPAFQDSAPARQQPTSVIESGPILRRRQFRLMPLTRRFVGTRSLLFGRLGRFRRFVRMMRVMHGMRRTVRCAMSVRMNGTRSKHQHRHKQCRIKQETSDLHGCSGLSV